VARKEGDILRKIPFSKTEEKGINVFIEENIFKNLIVLIFPFFLFSANLEILKKIEKIKIEGDSIF
jgi:hypothetical protein